MQLKLRDAPVRMVTFARNPLNFWFHAKPIVDFLEYTHLTHALAKVRSGDKRLLAELLAEYGPLSFPSDHVDPGHGPPADSADREISHYESIAMYINESGLYTLIIGSRRAEAEAFQYWLTHDVLPSLRRTGSYSCAARVVWAFTLKIVEFPAGVMCPVKECDLYLMLITEQPMEIQQTSRTWKIGRSNNPVQRALELQSEVKRLHGYDWSHSVVTIYRGLGDLESLMHREFRPSLVSMREYFPGEIDFPDKVSAAVTRLTATLIESQSQIVRQAQRTLQAVGDPEWEAACKRRRTEIDFAQEELALDAQRATTEAQRAATAERIALLNSGLFIDQKRLELARGQLA